MITQGRYPAIRPRRLRARAWLREMVAEHRLMPSDLVWPLFLVEGEGQRQPISTLPGVERYSIDVALEQGARALMAGIRAVALFPAVAASLKTPGGEEALNPENLLCRAVRAFKRALPELGIIGDVALDPYTTHGHDGVLSVDGAYVENDATVSVLCRQAVVLAAAGCDIIAPSDMMDGRIGAIRAALDEEGHISAAILSYAVKYASAFYGPFRDAVGSKTALGRADKRGYQMQPGNRREALREVMLDLQEGADMVMVKPGQPYLDILRDLAEAVQVPVFAYQVSGEYAMLRAAAAAGAFDFMTAMQESLLGFKRAGASAVFTYAALEVADALNNASAAA